jgi:hypothetical protein
MTTFDESTETEFPGGEAPDFEALLSAEFAKRLGLSVNEDEDDDFEDDRPAPTPEPVGDPDEEYDPTEDPSPTSDPAPAPARLTVPIPGTDQSYDVDVDTAQKLLGLAAWAEGLQPQTREAFAAIETGAAVPVTRADYERFLAWSQMQEREDAGRFGDDDEDATAREVAELRAEVARMRQQPIVDQYTQTADRATNIFIQTAESYAESRGLSEEQMGEVFQYAINAGVIGSIADSMRQYSPTGQLVRDADYGEVARRSFDFALVNHPQFRDRALAGPPSGASAPDPTAIKKARAGSLASAPSAAVSTPSIDVRQMSDFDRRAAMADELRAAMSGRA